MLRRLMATSASLAVVGFGIATMPVAVHAQTAGGCAVQGSATITPGLTPVPGAETVSFSGTATCAGLLAGAVFTPLTPVSFSGSLTGCLGSIEAGVCTDFSFTAGPLACSGGVLVQETALVEYACADAPSLVAAGVAVFIPNPVNQGTDVQTVQFVGATAGAGA